MRSQSEFTSVHGAEYCVLEFLMNGHFDSLILIGYSPGIKLSKGCS